MGSSVFVARETPLTAANLNKHLAGDGLPNSGDVALGGASGLFWDDANKRLGRGTPTPATALDWLDASAALHATWSTNGDADVVHWLTGDRDGSGAGARTAFVGLDYSANILKIGRGSDFDGTTGSVVVDSAGKVGIGTNSPGNLLHVAGIARFSNSDGASMLWVNHGASSGNTHTEVHALIDAGAGYGTLALQPVGGIIGIGTATPGSLLEINLATADLEIVDSGTAGATEAGWVEVQIGNTQMFLRAYATK